MVIGGTKFVPPFCCARHRCNRARLHRYARGHERQSTGLVVLLHHSSGAFAWAQGVKKRKDKPFKKKKVYPLKKSRTMLRAPDTGSEP